MADVTVDSATAELYKPTDMNIGVPSRVRGMSESPEVRMGVSDARANLTEVIAKVRLLGQRAILTRRDKPQAVLVSMDFYERAVKALERQGD